MTIKKLSHKELSDHLRREHDNVYNFYETPSCIELIENFNDIEAVIRWAEDQRVQYNDLINELEKHLPEEG